VTERDVDYEGSLTLDRDLMEACAMVPFERVEVYDVDNGSRFATYLIEGEPGSGVCCLNGAAAHLVKVGATYCSVHEAEVRTHEPVVVMVDSRNRATAVKRHEAAGIRVPE
jgi:aspartate 1-decarboxylase